MQSVDKKTSLALTYSMTILLDFVQVLSFEHSLKNIMHIISFSHRNRLGLDIFDVLELFEKAKVADNIPTPVILHQHV